MNRTTKSLIWFGFGAGVLALMSTPPKSPKSPSGVRKTPPLPTREIHAIITRAALKHGVPVPVAMAWAEVESRFNPNAAGDKLWASKRPGLYRDLVLVKLGKNPEANNPAAWHSYGLFQLLAPYHVGMTENPAILYNPEVNADRGLRTVANLLKRTHGDPIAARLLYVGEGSDPIDTPAEKAIAENIRGALSRWGYVG